MNSDTPRTDALIYSSLDLSQSTIAEFAQTLERENTAQLAELHRISEALGSNDGHSSVTHIEILKEENAALRKNVEKYRWFSMELDKENATLRELLRLCKPAVRNVYPSTDPLLEAIDAAMKEEGK